jgi:hypothetical protein
MKFVDRGIHLVYYAHHLALFPEQQNDVLSKILLFRKESKMVCIIPSSLWVSYANVWTRHFGQDIHLHTIPIVKKVWNFGHSIVMYAGPSRLRS